LSDCEAAPIACHQPARLAPLPAGVDDFTSGIWHTILPGHSILPARIWCVLHLQSRSCKTFLAGPGSRPGGCSV